MAMQAAMAEDETLDSGGPSPRRKTPVVVLAMLVGVVGLLVLWGYLRVASGPDEGTVSPEGRTSRAADLDGSAMAAMLLAQRDASRAGPRDPATHATAPVPTTPAVAGPTGLKGLEGLGEVSAFVPPTRSVPRAPISRTDENCKGGSLEARLRCLEEQWRVGQRRKELNSLDGALGDRDGMLLLGKQGQAAVRSGPSGGSVVPPPAEDPFGTLLFGGAGGPYGLGPMGPVAEADKPNPDPRIAFDDSHGGASKRGPEVGPLQKPGSFWLRAGSVVPCAFITAASSELPGTVVAQVTRNVYDSIDGSQLLIPGGSRLVGRQNAQVTPGQERLQLAWHELQLPDGEFRDIGGMAGGDGAGAAGVGGRVDRHWGRKLGLALFTSTINVSFHLATPNPGAGRVQDAVAQGVGEGVIQTATAALEKMGQVPDVIRIDPGTACSVTTTSSMSFPHAYHDGKQWRR